MTMCIFDGLNKSFNRGGCIPGFLFNKRGFKFHLNLKFMKKLHNYNVSASNYFVNDYIYLKGFIEI